MKTTHAQKVKMARKMRTSVQEGNSVPIFQTPAWMKQAEDIQASVAKKNRKQARLKAARLARRAENVQATQAA